jgi:hypothetical protein
LGPDGRRGEEVGCFFLSIDQQTQLVIGCGVFLGSLLGYFISVKFFLLSGFFGAGLIYAGLSGTCTLAMLIAKMPWNQNSKALSKNSCAMK